VRLVGAQPKINRRWPVLLLSGLSLLLSSLIFPRIEWWPLAYVCLVPWLVCVCSARRSRFVYLVSFLFGIGFFLINCAWLFQVTPPGYFALCLYYGVFFPLAAWPIRHMYNRHGVSVALTAPIAWVATEYLRSISVLGFPWLLLAHSHYRCLSMIQISDLVGAYGVSFVLVMVNGWITDLLIQPILMWRSDQITRLPIGSLTTLLVLFGALIYGGAQRSGRLLEPGPKVAVVQHDFPMFVDSARSARTLPEEVLDAYLDLARQAAAEKPDLIVLPETVVHGFINEEFVSASPTELDEIRRRRYPASLPLRYLTYLQEFSRQIRQSFQRISTESGVPLVVGSSSMEWCPTKIPPRADAFNSAFLFEPGRDRPTARYDKIHLVLFGEYVPFRYSYPPLYEWLNAQTPWGREGIEYSLSPGSAYTVFQFNAASQGGRTYRAAIPICYEEIMPYIARTFVKGAGGPSGRKNIDMLLSISNDGWFLHTSELEQHLAGAVFRAVENRIPVARSVNTGASAIIHPNGKIHHRVELSQEKIAAMGTVQGILRRLDASAAAMSEAAAQEASYQKELMTFLDILGDELKPALASLGTEYTYLYERLARVAVAFGQTKPPSRRATAALFRGDVAEDLDTMERWKDRPWTAPGYGIAALKLDERTTIYSRWGDWFAQGTLGVLAMMLLDWLLRRIWRKLGESKTQAQARARVQETAAS